MKKNILLVLLFFVAFAAIFSCSEEDKISDYEPISPVIVDLTTVPYPKLSDYKFFEGEMKNQVPSLDVIPYEPISSLFSDYAHKKRFVWVPKGQKATFNGDDKIVELPTGAVIIKTFYYDNVLPLNETKLIETRLMIRKPGEWIFANYVWNDDQTEAFLDLEGSTKNISWTDENNNVKNVDYRIPNEAQCIVCHKSKGYVDGVYNQKNIPIGLKPQNLNKLYNYGIETKNQLSKWIELGILESFSLPTDENTTVNYSDQSKSLDQRVRSYLDINCAHCHSSTGHCDYRPLRLPFSETNNNLINMGVCVDTQDMQNFEPRLSKLVSPGNIDRSMLHFRLNTIDETYRMPLHGRASIHEEGVQLVKEWINSLNTSCN
jgi:uncharacterized repeat protein (TIGR03806 family)